MKFCLLENKKVAWYQRLCTIETTILKRRKKCQLYYQLCSTVSCSVWIQLCCQSCVLCCCFKPCHLSSFTLMGPHSDVNNNTLPYNKIKSLLLTTNAFFVTFNSLLAKNVFVILINCYFIVHVFGIFSFTVDHFYIQTGKTVNNRNISGMLLCCKMKANWAWETKLQERISIRFCGFVASWRTLIFAVIGGNTINIPEIF